MRKIIGETESLCPICLKKIKAFKVEEGNNIYMVKSCREHGDFKTIIWRGIPKYDSWKREKTPAHPPVEYTEILKGCPYDCGLCSEHRQHT